MNQINEIEGTISKIRNHSQTLRDEITSLKEEDISARYYLGNLKRLSLQALDLFNAMHKQVKFLNNQKTYLAVSQPKRRHLDGISM